MALSLSLLAPGLLGTADNNLGRAPMISTPKPHSLCGRPMKGPIHAPERWLGLQRPAPSPPRLFLSLEGFPS